jgi:hypothetical protein
VNDGVCYEFNDVVDVIQDSNTQVMKSRDHNPRWRILAVVSMLLVVSCVRGKKQVYSDTKVIVESKHPPLYPFNVHGGETVYLEVGGRSFKNVRGTQPFYLNVPQSDSILFVTEGEPFRVTFHIFNLSTRRDTPIDGHGSSFGWNIGSKKKPGEHYTDYVENADSNRLVVVTRAAMWKEVTTLNLQSASAERVEIFKFNKDGAITNHFVYIGDKSEK